MACSTSACSKVGDARSRPSDQRHADRPAHPGLAADERLAASWRLPGGRPTPARPCCWTRRWQGPPLPALWRIDGRYSWAEAKNDWRAVSTRKRPNLHGACCRCWTAPGNDPVPRGCCSQPSPSLLLTRRAVITAARAGVLSRSGSPNFICCLGFICRAADRLRAIPRTLSLRSSSVEVVDMQRSRACDGGRRIPVPVCALQPVP